MKLQYLGTAAAEGWPALFCRCPVCREATRRGGRNLRSRSQAIIDDRILLDFCPDTLMHMQRFGMDLPEIKTCLITHTHEDHFCMDETRMRSFWFANDLEGDPFTLYGNDALCARMDACRAEPQGDVLTDGIAWRELTEYVPVCLEGYTVIPTIAAHNPAEKCFNYIVKKDGRSLFYGHDTSIPGDTAWACLAEHRFDLVSLDCTMLVRPVGNTHMNIEKCCAMRERMLTLGCADERTVFVINHFSHNGGIGVDGQLWLQEELEPLMADKGFLVAYDGMTVSV